MRFEKWLVLIQIYQLHRSLQHSKCVVLSGISGSGKTTCYKSLAGAYHYIRELRALGKQSHTAGGRKASQQTKIGSSIAADPADDYPRVDITVINPAAYSFEEVCILVLPFHKLSIQHKVHLFIYLVAVWHVPTERSNCSRWL